MYDRAKRDHNAFISLYIKDKERKAFPSEYNIFTQEDSYPSYYCKNVILFNKNIRQTVV